MTEEHETGSNHIVECVHRFINQKVKRGPVPRQLFVQLDNCTRENKNRYFLAYMKFLVSRQVFDQIEVGFLPVGHTREDIDQLFSTTSKRLLSNDAITLTDLLTELKQVYNSETTVRHMPKVAS